MKKLSFSLFALLAIVFAVASAFTTAKKSTTGNFRVIGINPSQITWVGSSPSSYTRTALVNQELIELYDDESEPSDDVLTIVEDAGDACQGAQNFVCAALVDNTTVYEVVKGNYQQ